MYIIRYEYYSYVAKEFLVQEVTTNIKVPMIAIGGIALFTNKIVKNFSYRKSPSEFCFGPEKLNDAMILKAYKEQLNFLDD